MVIAHGAVKTAWHAGGSHRTFHSAAGFSLPPYPTRTLPYMPTNRAFRAMPGSRFKAAAIFGTGPMQINVTGRGDCMIVSINACTPSRWTTPGYCFKS